LKATHSVNAEVVGFDEGNIGFRKGHVRAGRTKSGVSEPIRSPESLRSSSPREGFGQLIEVLVNFQFGVRAKEDLFISGHINRWSAPVIQALNAPLHDSSRHEFHAVLFGSDMHWNHIGPLFPSKLVARSGQLLVSNPGIDSSGDERGGGGNQQTNLKPKAFPLPFLILSIGGCILLSQCWWQLDFGPNPRRRLLVLGWLVGWFLMAYGMFWVLSWFIGFDPTEKVNRTLDRGKDSSGKVLSSVIHYGFASRHCSAAPNKKAQPFRAGLWPLVAAVQERAAMR
jgi:hypothetical protein